MEKYETSILVICPHCKQYLNEEEVEFINLEEDMEGKDRLTFKCPLCHKEGTSHRLG